MPYAMKSTDKGYTYELYSQSHRHVRLQPREWFGVRDKTVLCRLPFSNEDASRKSHTRL